MSRQCVAWLDSASRIAADGIGQVPLTWQKAITSGRIPLAGAGRGCDREPDRAPEKKQRADYSGKKRKHTLKAQVIVDQATGAILCTAFGKGRVHDFRLFKQHRVPMLPQQLCLADKGYQGLARLHTHSCTPVKKPKKVKLDAEQRQYNQMLASLRIVAEHTNRRLKIWRILAERCGSA